MAKNQPPPTVSFTRGLANRNWWLGLFLLVVVLIAWSLRVLREYQRAVMFQLGRYVGVKGPGLFFMIPIIQQMVKVDLRTIVHDVPPQDVITRDNVSVKVNAVVYFRVVDPEKAVIQVVDFLGATSQLAQTTLRAVLGKHELDEMLAERDKLNLDIQTVLDTQADAWGIKVSNVEIKHVDLNESMIRAIARQAEAERERRAKAARADQQHLRLLQLELTIHADLGHDQVAAVAQHLFLGKRCDGFSRGLGTRGLGWTGHRIS